MKVLILEDENRAANHLRRLIGVVAPDMKVIAVCESIRESVDFLHSNQEPALLFADVQLADGLSFEVFKQVDLGCPIIFTTAYDTYAIEAFNANGIDYLLKPVEEERLRKAITKARMYATRIDWRLLQDLNFQPTIMAKKSRFMVKVGEKIKSIPAEDIKAFYSFEKATFLHTLSDRRYIIDHSLDELRDLLDNNRFFRINRKYIVSIDACSQIIAWSNSRLKLDIQGIDDQKIVVAREKVQEFKAWLDR